MGDLQASKDALSCRHTSTGSHAEVIQDGREREENQPLSPVASGLADANVETTGRAAAFRILGLFLGPCARTLSSLADERGFQVVFVEQGLLGRGPQHLAEEEDAFAKSLQAGRPLELDPANEASVSMVRRLLQGADCLVHSCTQDLALRLCIDASTLRQVAPHLEVIKVTTALGGSRLLKDPRLVGSLLRQRLAQSLARAEEATRHNASNDTSASQERKGRHVTTGDVETLAQVNHAHVAVTTVDGRIQVPLAELPRLASLFAPDILSGGSGEPPASYTELRVSLSRRLRQPGGPSVATLLKQCPSVIAL